MTTVEDSRIERTFLLILVIDLLPTAISQLLTQQFFCEKLLIELRVEWV